MAEESSESSLLFPNVEPCPSVVDGAQLLDDLVARFKRHSILPPHGAETVALWILFAWAFDAWAIAPLLQISAPERASGKSRLLELIGTLVPKPLATGSISAAAMFRVIEAHGPTLLVDEVDTFLKENRELVGVLNNGHLRSQAYVVRCHGDEHEVKAFRVWSPKVLCGIGELPDTLASRCISIQMKRKRTDEKVERLRADRLEWAVSLKSRCARWAADCIEGLREADPELPDELDDRAQDNWRSLIAIADLVGEGWPQKARAAAIGISAPQATGNATRGVQLLSDIRLVFEQGQVAALAPEKLAAALRKLPDGPWASMSIGTGLNTQQIAKMLAPYGIQSRRNHDGRFYDRRGFEDAWARYCPAPLPKAVAGVAPDTQAGVEAIAANSHDGGKDD
ncbi:DUF3631 domain-containing protein [Novosphingobium bradum]|uniref:DUF3631 domain-containing protein n=1 Tax=Novosphingobium bradum TaxID=1737444 RepID=A0ABV7IQQ9_9SPHN